MQPTNLEGALQPSTPALSSAPRRLIALLALPLLFAGKSAPAQDRALCKEGFLEILSPDPRSVSVGQCREVAKQTMAAWRFDASQMQWAGWIDMEKPLTMRVLSVARMKAEHAGVLGFAQGRDLFVVSAAVLDDPFANGTLAHELAHIQAKRALGKRSEQHAAPRYFIEGHGNILGLAYRDHLRVTEHDYDVRKARQILRLTPDLARTILTDDGYGASDKAEMDQMESMGIFFVEYMRVRYGRTGVPDMVARMGRVFEAVGRGGSYESAFREQFGTPVDRVVSEIVAFVRRTAANPAERLQGTRYARFR